MGKTAKGAVWLDPNKTTPFEFYQYWRNIDDADVMKCMKMLTFIPLDEIAEIEKWDDSRINEKKELLAYSLTELVHGKEEADKAQATAHALFSGQGQEENMPSTQIEAANLTDGKIGVLDLMAACGLAPSKSEVRRLIQQGGVTIDGEKVSAVDAEITEDQLKNGVVIKKGKKVFHRAYM